MLMEWTESGVHFITFLHPNPNPNPPNTRSDTHHHTVIPGVLSKGGHPCRAFDTTREVLKAFQRPVLWGVASLEVGSLWIPLGVQAGGSGPACTRGSLAHVCQSVSSNAINTSSDFIF